MLSKNQLKEIQALQLKKQRDARELFIVEGIKTVEEVLTQQPKLLVQVYATAAFLQQHQTHLHEANVNFTEVSDEELAKISLQATPNQVLGVCRFFPKAEWSFDPTSDFSVYLDDIRDPGNLGTIIRLADWYGVKTIFCSPETCELYNPKVIQASMGAFLRVQVEYLSLQELICEIPLTHVYGAVLGGENLYQQQLTPGILVIGNEANGIREENRKLLTRQITIPKHPDSGAESLNAAVATSIIVSEFYRQLKN